MVRADTIPGFHIVTGLSGHGFGIGPGVGKVTAELLTGGAVRMVTGTLVGIEFDFASWQHIGQHSGRLTFTVPPRLLTDGNLELG